MFCIRDKDDWFLCNLCEFVLALKYRDRARFVYVKPDVFHSTTQYNFTHAFVLNASLHKAFMCKYESIIAHNTTWSSLNMQSYDIEFKSSTPRITTDYRLSNISVHYRFLPLKQNIQSIYKYILQPQTLLSGLWMICVSYRLISSIFSHL